MAIKVPIDTTNIVTAIVTAALMSLGGAVVFITSKVAENAAYNQVISETRESAKFITKTAGQIERTIDQQKKAEESAETSLKNTLEVEKKSTVSLGKLDVLVAAGKGGIASTLASNEDFVKQVASGIKARPDGMFGDVKIKEINVDHTADSDGLITVITSGGRSNRGYSVMIGKELKSRPLSGVMFDPRPGVGNESYSVQASGTFVVPKGSIWMVQSVAEGNIKGKPTDGIEVRWIPFSL